MKYNKIILAGGNGYLGGVLADYYRPLAKEIIILSRHAMPANGNICTLLWDGKTEGEWATALEDADLLVNLCGKNVNCRYTAKNKAEIFSSRLLPTALLGKVIAKLSNPPKLWINIASATIYRHAEDRPQHELNGEIGSGFSVDVCTRWEKVFFDTDTPQTRKIVLRMGIVLGKHCAVLPPLLNLVKTGMGGRQGNGQQYVGWVHEMDAARSTEFLLDNDKLTGPFNCTAPKPVKNYQLMKVLRKACSVPFGLPMPKWLLNLGAIFIGTETELILKSRWVLPKRLLDAGYQFYFNEAEPAINDILNSKIKQ